MHFVAFEHAVGKAVAGEASQHSLEAVTIREPFKHHPSRVVTVEPQLEATEGLLMALLTFTN